CTYPHYHPHSLHSLHLSLPVSASTSVGCYYPTTPPTDPSDVSVLLGTGNGAFQAQQRFTVGAAPYSVAVADVNGDGRLDLVTANYDSNDVSVLLGNGEGGVEAAPQVGGGGKQKSVAGGGGEGGG